MPTAAEIQGRPNYIGLNYPTAGAYDQRNASLRVSGDQKFFRENFSGALLDPNIWATDLSQNNGGAIAVAADNMTFTSGVTPNSILTVTSVDAFTLPLRLSFGLSMSQRIANNTLLIQLVSCDPLTGIPDDKNTALWLFNNTIATNGIYRVRGQNGSLLNSGGVTIPSTATPACFEIEVGTEDIWFHASAQDSIVGRANSYRRQINCPDPNALYKIRISMSNAATAPASSTVATFSFVTVQDFNEFSTKITGARGSAAQGQSLPVTLAANATVIGPNAHGGVASSAPFRVAGRAMTAAYASVASGQVADLMATVQGVQTMRPWTIPELEWSFPAPSGGVINTTDVVVKAAAGAGLRNYITSLSLKNANAVAGEVVLKDGATIIWRGHLSASMVSSEQITFADPLKTTANAALNFACITTGQQVYVNAQGYIAP